MAQDFLQAASNAAASNVSGPVDALAWLLRKAGVPVPDDAVGGSKWMEQQGLTRPVKPGLLNMAGETAGLLAPIAAAAKAPQIAKGLLQMGENAAAPRMLNPQRGVLDVDYRGQHTAPMKGDGSAPLHDLARIYPDDIYGANAAQYYGHYGGGNPVDRETISMMQRLKGRPDAAVTMYRAVPHEPSAAEKIAKLEKQKAAFMKRGTVPPEFGNSKGFYDWASGEIDRLSAMPADAVKKMVINNGDWVTINKKYAQEHGESALDGKYKIISKKVPARKLFTNADSIHEFGYDESGRAALAALGLLGVGAGGVAYLGSDKN